MAEYYQQPHVSQFDGSWKQGDNCVPASLANGADASTGGAVQRTGAQIRALLAPWEETNPGGGWSVPDADTAMQRLGVPYENRTGDGWDKLESWHKSGHYITLQGDSDVFSNETCSGAFNGDHMIGIHPKTRIRNGHEEWLIDDPICKTARWERKSVIRRYGEKLATNVRFGMFSRAVPWLPLAPDTGTVTLRYGGRIALHAGRKQIKVGAGKRAIVRTRPAMNAPRSPKRPTIRNGGHFYVAQVAGRGADRWFGNRTGRRWVHSSSF